MNDENVGAFTTFRQFFALQGDVLVLSVAMFAFSLGFQMTGRYMPRYMSVLGAGSVAIGLDGRIRRLAVRSRLRLLDAPGRAGRPARSRGGRVRGGDGVGVVGTAYFLVFGEEFEAYA